ncbi:polycystin family receptor for egg jelly-like isoform X2 [Argopecten irradians]|uniref:polycystin family receptor for egg jelly-like isoform X2 n=1 Tax=Argopecten irradians TaxID=31199 RepID=UPI00371963DA
MSYQIFLLTPSLLCTGCPMTIYQAKSVVIRAEESLLELVKLLLSQVNVEQITKHDGVIPYTMFSLAYTKAKGPNLPYSYKTKYGSFDLPYWETFHDLIKYETVSVIFLTYETSPYLFASNADDISSGLVKTVVTDINGHDLLLEDPDDPIALDADAKQAVSPVQGWETLERTSTQEGAFLAVVAFNFTVHAVIVDLKLATTKLCTTYGSYGTSIPTEAEFDVKVETKGKSRLKSVFPEEFSASFSNQVLQLALNYKGDESLTKPFLIIVMCEDTSLFENDAQGHEFRLSLVDLRYFNPRTAEWEKTQNVELSSGKASTVAFKSKIFGTFSADMLLLPPDTIDFSAVFLNFAERLRSNPYALTVILCLWAILILIAIGLRRMDIQDEALWNYLPLVDNNPWNTAGYYMTVSTALRSSRNLTSTPYFNMVGSEGDTGARILNDGVRKNFRRGTTSHFYMTTPSHLGNLKRMTVWHDNEGTSPKWLLAKIVVQDLTDNKRYAFVCGKWMALDREDGKVWKRLKAQDEQTIDSHLLFSELSLRQMFDDNLWFSISTRPHF